MARYPAAINASHTTPCAKKPARASVTESLRSATGSDVIPPMRTATPARRPKRFVEVPVVTEPDNERNEEEREA